MRTAGMRLSSCSVWLLCTLLLCASLDTVPDPPAVRPCQIDIKTIPATDLEISPISSLSCSGFAGPRIVVRWIALRQVLDIKRPVDLIALVQQAADPSPPVFV